MNKGDVIMQTQTRKTASDMMAAWRSTGGATGVKAAILPAGADEAPAPASLSNGYNWMCGR
ncbi:hypothetical protein [uncultured Tistrella sp.]|uniref:hypothetical protein n=2 Tax=Tistrella mobilis TaxID=171437 RepID=UPI000C0AE6ED|nr:hypothetical protein [uncultured Tistrella sp.]MAM72667.1 hypothetical protein [Tistrella sp.]